ncbi:MAG: tetratricopeptide repeat protein [Oligoflexia bacterium]|nr:tetratricopeptide repeat protein [Oligoflexia bacterium]
MATRVHVIWTLILLVFWAFVFGVFNKHFDGAHLEKRKIAKLERKLHLQFREVAKLETKFDEYKDAMVVAGIKIDSKFNWNDSKRSIASVIADPSIKSKVSWSPGTVSFNHAKKVFKSQNFKRSAELLENFMKNYPDHPSSPLAAFLLGESYFQIGNMHDSLRAINILISHFPETETACLGMLRLGKIFEKQARLEDAQEVYELTLPNYPESKCSQLAKASIKGLNL